ncbi:MAG: hypothetical protein WAV20_12820, partial [Blastocatellia bacterium]
YMTMNLSHEPFTFCLRMDALFRASENAHLALVVRSDAAVRADEQANLEDNLDYMLSHPLIERFAFDTPAEMLIRQS